MPVYSYICKKCGNKFDVLLRGSQKEDELVCRQCGSRQIKKAFARFGVGKNNSQSSGSCPDGTCPLG